MLYFLEDFPRGSIDAEQLAQVGLGYLYDPGEPAGIECRACATGPGGKRGLVVCVSGETCVYDPAQTWAVAPGLTTRIWVGYDPRAGKPGPAELARTRQVEGTALRLLDGKQWIVPRAVAPLPERPITLPLRYELDGEGQWTGRPLERYRKLCEEAYRYWQSILAEATAAAGGKGQGTDGAQPPLTVAEALELAAEALAVNYRVSRAEVSLLGLLGDDQLRAVLAALVDLEEVKKKARPAT